MVGCHGDIASFALLALRLPPNLRSANKGRFSQGSIDVLSFKIGFKNVPSFKMVLSFEMEVCGFKKVLINDFA